MVPCYLRDTVGDGAKRCEHDATPRSGAADIALSSINCWFCPPGLASQLLNKDIASASVSLDAVGLYY